MTPKLVSGVVLCLLLGASSVPVYAQSESNAKAGLAFARRACSACHDVRNDPGSAHDAASFVTIANAPSMTETALSVFIQTSHRSMPNIRLEPQEMRDVVAYILSLKRTP